LNKLNTKVNEMYIKIEALTDELLSMKRLNGQLKEHNTHLKEAVQKSEEKLVSYKKKVPFVLKESPIVEISEITPP
jgi:predicted  nucleic acid-binding Zn-ribbon protein